MYNYIYYYPESSGDQFPLFVKFNFTVTAHRIPAASAGT